MSRCFTSPKWRERFYQRLLALDYHDASAIAGDFWKPGSVEQRYETMRVLALSLAERDRQAGNLGVPQRHAIYQSIKDVVAELGEPAKRPGEAGPGAGTPAEALCVLCLPAEAAAVAPGGTTQEPHACARPVQTPL